MSLVLKTETKQIPVCQHKGKIRLLKHRVCAECAQEWPEFQEHIKGVLKRLKEAHSAKFRRGIYSTVGWGDIDNKACLILWRRQSLMHRPLEFLEEKFEGYDVVIGQS